MRAGVREALVKRLDGPARNVHCADDVLESRVFGRRIDPPGRLQLMDLSQSLHLLNSRDMQTRLQRGGGRASLLARADERSDEEKIRELYLAAFSREPTAEEQSFVIQSITAYSNKQQAWEDVLWAIFNAKEFQFVR